MSSPNRNGQGIGFRKRCPSITLEVIADAKKAADARDRDAAQAKAASLSGADGVDVTERDENISRAVPNRNWRKSDMLYAIPFFNIVLGQLNPSKFVDRGAASLVGDRLIVAEALGLLSALLLTVIGATYIALEAEELATVNLQFTIGEYGCISKSDPGTPLRQINLEGELVGIGMAAICFSVLALFLAIVAIIGGSSVASNRSRQERKRFWKWAWLLYISSMGALIVATCSSAWFYLKFYMLKYPMQVFTDLCKDAGWVPAPSGNEIGGVVEHTCVPQLPGRTDCIVWRNVIIVFDYWGTPAMGNPTFVISVIYMLTAIFLLSSLWLLGFSYVFVERGKPKISKDGQRIYDAYKHKWSEKRIVKGQEVWSLHLTWTTVSCFAENPDLLDSFLEDCDIEDTLDRANLRPLMCDMDFMGWQHPSLGKILNVGKSKAKHIVSSA